MSEHLLESSLEEEEDECPRPDNHEQEDYQPANQQPRPEQLAAPCDDASRLPRQPGGFRAVINYFNSNASGDASSDCSSDKAAVKVAPVGETMHMWTLDGVNRASRWRKHHRKRTLHKWWRFAAAVLRRHLPGCDKLLKQLHNQRQRLRGQHWQRGQNGGADGQENAQVNLWWHVWVLICVFEDYHGGNLL